MKRALAIAAALSLPLSLGTISTGATAAAPGPQIEDPFGDANFINDQGTGDGSTGDQAPGADAGNASDLGTVTFSNDAKNLYVLLQNEQSPPATQGLGLRVRVNGAPGSQCLLFEAYYSGATNTLTAVEGYFRDTCAGGDPVPVEVLGTQLIIPRSLHEAFGKGKTLDTPQAQSFVYTGSSYPAGAGGPYVDTTKVGTDYKMKR